MDKFDGIIPDRMGMQNVQFLIVNREDHTKLCGVGEVGEIMVGTAGLGEISVIL